jgi:UDP-N-acetylglucosamine diphosphorylase/glucosamine-1-phosphate N-acetyltransferase
MNVILFDEPEVRRDLLPLTYTRPVAGIRMGILTIAEKWEKHLHASVSFSTDAYLGRKFPLKVTTDNYWVNGCFCPTPEFIKLLHTIKEGEGIRQGNRILALRTSAKERPQGETSKYISFNDDLNIIDKLWKIFQFNGAELRADFSLLTAGRKSAPINDKATVVYNESNVFIEEGVTFKANILNAEPGPIYLSHNSQVQEGAIIRGPFSLGEGSIINMGGKMRGDTTIGPDCKVGGEVSNSILFAHSNKSHDGFLGNSVLGEWCNLGADTNTSNMKNNYDTVKLWNIGKKSFENTGLNFCGLVMGDHSKSGINTMFNTGTVVGVNANVIGGGYPPNFIPSFSWGGNETYVLEKAFASADRAMRRRQTSLSEDDRHILENVFSLTSPQRTWDKQ